MQIEFIIFNLHKLKAFVNQFFLIENDPLCIKIVCTVAWGSIRLFIDCETMAKNIVKLGLLARLFQNLKLLLPLIRDYWKGTYRDVSIKSIVIFLMGLVYIISPIDIIPDYIIGLGQIDDVAILGTALYFLERDLIKYKKWKDRQG